MADKTGIEWTDATWNPVRGCSRVSEGCRHCYAETVAARFSGPGQPYEGLADRARSGSKWTGVVRLVEEHLVDPLRWKRPRRIFVNSMSDLFHEALTNEQIATIFAVMAYCEQHTFQVLTKRPKRMLDWFRWVNDDAGAFHGRELDDSPFVLHRMERVDQDLAERFLDATPDGVDLGACLHNHGVWPPKNIWLGVSVENQETADERIPLLLKTPAAVRFISAEPLLGPIDLREMAHVDDWYVDALDTPDPSRRLSWVIVGGESGQGARPCNTSWVRSIVLQCASASVPVFVKQLGAVPFDYVNATVGHSGDLRAFTTNVPRLDTISLHENGRMVNTIANQMVTGKGGDMAEWPEDLRVREFPNAVNIHTASRGV